MQPPPSTWSVVRELVGLLLLSAGTFVALFTLIELSPLVAALSLVAFVAGMAAGGMVITEAARTQRLRRSATAVTVSGLLPLILCAYLLWHPLGQLGVAYALVAGGVWLSSEGEA